MSCVVIIIHPKFFNICWASIYFHLILLVLFYLVYFLMFIVKSLSIFCLSTLLYLSNLREWANIREPVSRRCSFQKMFFRVPFLIKLQVAPETLFKRRPWHKCFPVNFAKFLRTLTASEHKVNNSRLPLVICYLVILNIMSHI